MVEQVAVEFPPQFHLNLSNPGRSRGESPGPPVDPWVSATDLDHLWIPVETCQLKCIWSNMVQYPTEKDGITAFYGPPKKSLACTVSVGLTPPVRQTQATWRCGFLGPT